MTSKLATNSSGSLARRLKNKIRDLRRPFLLALAARRRAKSAASFVAVTGSSGKSTTVGLLSHILSASAVVRTQILHGTIAELPRTMRRLSGVDHVVAEIGADTPGNIARMAAIVRPDIAVVTMVGIEHYSAFRSREAVAREKGALVEMVSPGGLAVLNADDPQVMGMAGRTAARVVTFGWSEGADYRVLRTSGVFPDRLAVTIGWRGNEITLATPFAGEHFWLATAAAFATAIEIGLEPDRIAERIASFETIWNRCGVHPTPGGPTFIIDTIKAPAESIPAVVRLMAGIPAVRKRIVLGQISDYPGAANPRYREAYRLAREACDQVIFVGDNSHRSRASEEDRKTGRFVEFFSVEQASDFIRASAVPGEVILLKSARNLHLERIALAWRGDVRCWQQNCGKAFDCLTCGLHDTPWEEHRAVLKARRRRRALGRLIWWRGAPGR